MNQTEPVVGGPRRRACWRPDWRAVDVAACARSRAVPQARAGDRGFAPDRGDPQPTRLSFGRDDEMVRNIADTPSSAGFAQAGATWTRFTVESLCPGGPAAAAVLVAAEAPRPRWSCSQPRSRPPPWCDLLRPTVPARDRRRRAWQPTVRFVSRRSSATTHHEDAGRVVVAGWTDPAAAAPRCDVRLRPRRTRGAGRSTTIYAFRPSGRLGSVPQRLARLSTPACHRRWSIARRRRTAGR